jgi:hypothetical protein
MAITAKPTSYTVNTGHAKCPTHLWMLDEGTSTIAYDKGSGTALDATLQNSGMWAMDGSRGIIITCRSTPSEWYATTETGTLWTSSVLMVAICNLPAIQDAGRTMMGCADSTVVGERCSIVAQQTTGYTNVLGVDSAATTIQIQNATNSGDDTWHMFAGKFKEGTAASNCAVSVDGAAWTNDGTTTFANTVTNRYRLGARAASTGNAPINGYLLACFAYEDGTYSSWDDAWIAELYDDPWQFLTLAGTSITPNPAAVSV